MSNIVVRAAVRIHYRQLRRVWRSVRRWWRSKVATVYPQVASYNLPSGWTISRDSLGWLTIYDAEGILQGEVYGSHPTRATDKRTYWHESYQTTDLAMTALCRRLCARVANPEHAHALPIHGVP